MRRSQPVHVREVIPRVMPKLADPPPGLDQFDVDAAWGLAGSLASSPAHRRSLMSLAGWLWKTGLHDMGLVLAIVERCVQVKPLNVYGYFAPGGVGRTAESMRYYSMRAEHMQREWLTR